MQMINVLKKLAELDSASPQVEKTMTQEQSLATVTNIEGETVSECGPMGMGGTTPASFSINASAESGDEVAGMLTQIMTLAGITPSSHQEIELEPAHALEIEPEQSAGDEMSDLIGMVDRMNGGDDVSVAQGDVDGDGDHDKADHDLEKTDSPVAKMADEVRDMTSELAAEGGADAGGFGDVDTTAEPEVKPHAYGNDQVTPKPDEPLKKAGGGNPYTESVEVQSVSAQLLKAYEAFKNQQ